VTERADLAVNPGIWMTGWDRARSDDVIRTIVQAGIDRVVVGIRDPHRFVADGIREEVDAAGLGIVANTNQVAHEDVSSDDREVRIRGMARLRRALAHAHALGADQLTGVLYSPLGKAGGPVSDRVRARTARLIGELADEAAELGIRVTCEVVNRYETAMLTTARAALDFVERSGSERLGIHLDLFHMNIEEDDIVEAIALALPRLGYLEIEQNHRGELRAGHLPVLDILTGVFELGYRGRFGLEAFTVSALAPEHATVLAVWRDVLEAQTGIAADARRLLDQARARSRVDDAPNA